MAYKINENCIYCGACETLCPNEAIYESGNKYQVDPKNCIECGICASGCAMGAIELE